MKVAATQALKESSAQVLKVGLVKVPELELVLVSGLVPALVPDLLSAGVPGSVLWEFPKESAVYFHYSYNRSCSQRVLNIKLSLERTMKE